MNHIIFGINMDVKVLIVLTCVFLLCRGDSIKYYSMWSDSSGETHQTPCRIDNIPTSGFSDKNNPQGVYPKDGLTSKVLFNSMPPKWRSNWHYSPANQIVIATQGCWEITTTDGTKRVYGPGDISICNDTKINDSPNPSNSKFGHLSKWVGTKSKTQTTLLVVQLDPDYRKSITIDDAKCVFGGVEIK